jgi:hypothetical protein
MIFVEVSCSSEWIEDYIDANPHSTEEALAQDRAQYESESFVVRIDDLKGMSVDDCIDDLYDEGVLNEYNYDWATSGRSYKVMDFMEGIKYT